MRTPNARRRGLLTFGAAVATTLAMAAPAAAVTSPGTVPDPSEKITNFVLLEDGSVAENVPDRWFVELAEPAAAEGGSEAAIASEQEALADAVDDADLDATITTEYTELWNGVAMEIDEDDLEEVAALDEVVSVQPVVVIPNPGDTADTDSVTDEEAEEGLTDTSMVNALEMTGADIAQNELGLTGEGVKIGIIDSGVDYDHFEFGGTGESDTTSFPTEKVKWGYDFVGDDFGANDTYDAVPDAYPDDCGGHGTHVAGIAAADGEEGTDQIVGVAPDAELGAYRVFGCDGSTTAEVMASAMEMSAEDGMDVVNMSIGADYVVFTDYPTVVSADNLAASGVIVVVAQGNAGDKGTYTMGAPGSSENVITVGSVENTIQTGYYARVSTSPDEDIYYSIGTGSGAPLVRDDDAAYPLMASGAADTDAYTLCEPVEEGLYEGHTVLVRRGACTFRTKVLNAQAAGAEAVIIDNNVAGSLGVTVAASEDDGETITIPVTSISMEEGDVIRAGLDESSTITWTTQHSETANATGGEMSDFSSWGLNSNLSLKPDVSAPGGKIWSTWPLDHDGPYDSISGTSMATPYTTGVVALLLQQYPEIKDLDGTDARNEVLWRLRSTASPRVWTEADGDASLLEPLARQGAGLVNVTAAATATLEASPSVLNLGMSVDGPATTTVTLTNHAENSATYTLGHTDAVTITGLSSSPEQGTTTPATVSSDGQSVTLAAGASTEVEITITAPADITDGDFYSGWVTLTQTDGDAVVRIPYSGVGGNLGQDEVFAAEGGDAPALYSDVLGGYVDYSYEFVPYSDLVYMLFVPQVPINAVYLNVYEANADGTKGDALGASYVEAAREEAVSRFDLGYVGWDGSYYDDEGNQQQASSGQYILELLALPIGAEGDTLDDYAVWDSEPVTIDWQDAGYIAQSELTVTSPEAAGALTDDNVFSNWSAEESTTVTLDLGAIFDVTAVQYTPDQTSAQARPVSATITTSRDGVRWGGETTVELGAGWDPTVIEIDPAEDARYVRVTLTGADGGAVSAGELRVAGELSAEVEMPSYVAMLDESDLGTILYGDWDGDGVETYAAYRGYYTVFYNENSASAAAASWTLTDKKFDEIFVGDWDGDGKDTLAFRRGKHVYYQVSYDSSRTTHGKVDASAQLEVVRDGDHDVLQPVND